MAKHRSDQPYLGTVAELAAASVSNGRLLLNLARRHARAQSRAGECLTAARFVGLRTWIADLAAYAPSAIQPTASTRTAMTTRPENRESGCPLQLRDRHLILRLTVAATNDNVGRKKLVAHHASHSTM
jgi:hypothetical protein